MPLLSKDNISIKLYVPDELNSVSAVQYQAENVGAMWRGGDVNSGALLSSEGKDVGSFIKGLVSGAYIVEAISDNSSAAFKLMKN